MFVLQNFILKFGLENYTGLQANLVVQNARCTGIGESLHAPILKVAILTWQIPLPWNHFRKKKSNNKTEKVAEAEDNSLK